MSTAKKEYKRVTVKSLVPPPMDPKSAPRQTTKKYPYEPDSDSDSDSEDE